MSDGSRSEMWRHVLPLPYDMLGQRPPWITLSYPGNWRRWVPDGRQLEHHRRAFAERWYRGFGERPLGVWSKEFQLREGRPHLHLLLKGPDVMSEADYPGFQEYTRACKANERRLGKYEGRAANDIVGARYGGETAMKLRLWWSEIVRANRDRKHHGRGVNVRTVFYAHDSSVAQTMKRAALAVYMAGETAKMEQKVPPLGFGTVGRYFGEFGRKQAFGPQVERMELEGDVWEEMNRRLTLLAGFRRQARARAGKLVGEGWKQRRPWQGLTVSRLGPDDYGKLLVRSSLAAHRKRLSRRDSGVPPEPEAAAGPSGFDGPVAFVSPWLSRG